MTNQLSNPEQAFDKALYLLDQDEGEKAEALLELVISAARTSDERPLLARALCVLGEWLHEQGRNADARSRLAEVLRVQVDEADLIAYERKRARVILSRLGSEWSTTASHKELKLTRPDQDGASRLNAGVRHTTRGS